MNREEIREKLLSEGDGVQRFAYRFDITDIPPDWLVQFIVTKKKMILGELFSALPASRYWNVRVEEKEEVEYLGIGSRELRSYKIDVLVQEAIDMRTRWLDLRHMQAISSKETLFQKLKRKLGL